MVRAYLHKIRVAAMGALGITILLGTPLLAQADQGKWWTPKQGDQRVEKRDRGGHGRDQGSRDPGSRGTWRGRGGADRSGGGAWRGRDGAGQGTWRDRNGSGDRGAWRGSGDVRVRDRGGVRVRDRVITNRSFGDRGFRGSVTYRDRRIGARGTWGGGSSWRGYPVRRDILVIQDRRYGGYFRARRVYCAPRYYGRFVYVRPVRFFISADALIGGIGLHARIVRPHYLYGCNFCDDRFDSYGGYCQHVEHCAHRPAGLDISVSNWDDGSEDWDGPYSTDGAYQDRGSYDDEDQGQYDDHGSYDDDDGGYDDESH